MQVIPDSYFEELIRRFRIHYLDHMSTVKITNKDLPPKKEGHEEVCVTTLFFGHQKVAMLIQATMYEILTRGGVINCHIHFKIRGQLLPVGALERLTKMHTQPIPFLEVIKEQVGDFARSDKVRAGSKFLVTLRQPIQDSHPLPVERITRTVGEVVRPIFPYLSRFFTDLDLSGCPPLGTFANCEELFWSRFDHGTLERFIISPVFKKERSVVVPA